MSIEEYYQSQLAAVALSPYVQTYDIELDKRGPELGLIRGEVRFLDFHGRRAAGVAYWRIRSRCSRRRVHKAGTRPGLPDHQRSASKQAGEDAL